MTAGALDLPDPQIHPDAYVAASAQIFGRVRVEAGAVIMFGVVVRAEFDDVEVGAETNLQDNTVVHVDAGRPCLIGRRVTVGHAAVLHGASVGDRCLVGVRAVALNGAVMGEGSWLAAGSVLTPGSSIPAWTLAVGVPAKPIRELTREEIAQQDEGVDHYLTLAATYRRLGV